MGRRSGGGAGAGDVDPSRLREEKDGMSGLPTDITRRLPEAGGGEERIWRGRGGPSSGRLMVVAASLRQCLSHSISLKNVPQFVA